MSGSRSRYSKTRSNSASEDWISTDTRSSETIGKNRRVWSVVKATIVPALIACPPPSMLRPATR